MTKGNPFKQSEGEINVFEKELKPDVLNLDFLFSPFYG